MLGPAGGTRAWRRLVAAVLARDGYVCQMKRDGHRCGAPATTANHIVHRALGGPDTLDNLEAACVPCNLRDGGLLRGRAGLALVAHHNVTVALVALLDRHGVPHDAGRRAALDAIARHSSHPYRNTQVDAAVRYRRHRGPLTRI
jgi:hypothetical protein